jgi:hypothetical protein
MRPFGSPGGTEGQRRDEDRTGPPAPQGGRTLGHRRPRRQHVVDQEIHRVRFHAPLPRPKPAPHVLDPLPRPEETLGGRASASTHQVSPEGERQGDGDPPGDLLRRVEPSLPPSTAPLRDRNHGAARFDVPDAGQDLPQKPPQGGPRRSVGCEFHPPDQLPHRSLVPERGGPHSEPHHSPRHPDDTVAIQNAAARRARIPAHRRRPAAAEWTRCREEDVQAGMQELTTQSRKGVESHDTGRTRTGSGRLRFSR